MKQTVTGTVLVTGGTGFVGSHLVELLLRRGNDVTCMVRDPDRLRWLSGRKVRVVAGDCSDPGSLEKAVRNVSVIYHVAGLTKAFRSADYYAVNQQGTRNVLEACGRNNPDLRKFVLVSSLAAAGPSQKGRPVTDGDAPKPVSDYGRSKLFAEAEALKFKDRFPVVIIRPSAVYGPRDTDVFELFKWASKGLILDMLGGERFLNWCYVDDLAEALFLAGERTVPSGSVYFVAEDRVYSATEFHQALQRTGRVQAQVIKVPVWVGYAIGALSEAAGALRGAATIMSRQKVREAVQEYWTCDLAKARQDLGFSAQVPLEMGLELTWKWYREHQWISR
jgi:nucleoside-diphosphate-sugar epimerase